MKKRIGSIVALSHPNWSHEGPPRVETAAGFLRKPLSAVNRQINIIHRFQEKRFTRKPAQFHGIILLEVLRRQKWPPLAFHILISVPTCDLRIHADSAVVGGKAGA